MSQPASVRCALTGADVGEVDGEDGDETAPKGDSERTEILQISWEVLDVARVVYAKHEDKVIAL